MKLILTVCSLLFMGAIACAQISKDYVISDVSKKLEVSTGINCAIEFGTTNSLKITSNDAEFFEDIKVENNNGILKIYCERSKDENKKWLNRSINAVLTLTKVPSELLAASSGEIYWDKKVKTTDLKMKCSSGGNININIEATSINANCQSGAAIEIAGNTKQLNVEASSGATINTKELLAANVTAISVSGGNIKCSAIETIIAETFSGGNIKYYGNAKCLNKIESSGGTITNKKTND